MLSPAARELRCLDELLGARAIIESGTSSHRQLATYERAVDAGAEPLEALREVVDFLIEETVAFKANRAPSRSVGAATIHIL